MTDRGSSRRQQLPAQPPQAAQQDPPATVERPENVPLRSASGSSRRMLLPTAGAPLETQPTVITKSPVLAEYPLAGLNPREMGRLLEGESLGHFDLLEYVGGGGMGAVFRAHDTMLNRTVAVKVLSQDQSGDEETLRRFQNEAQSAARLDHENISRVYYVGEDRGWHYIVFEFIEGSNLRDIVAQRGPLPLEDAVSYTLQVADALVHASRRDVVHRDIKPSNVLVTPEGRAKLVDMGLARLHQVEPGADDLTASGVTLGTFDYISPEQARDPRSADVRSDIYSLGCSLYFMLTGRPPFPDGTVLQKLLQHQGDEPPDVRSFRPDLPGDLIRIMDRMLAKSPDRRYPSPSELVAELTNFAGRHGFPITDASDLIWRSPSQMALSFWERHLPWVASLVALGLIVTVLGLVWSRERDQSVPPPLRPLTTTGSNATPGADRPQDNTAPPQVQPGAATPSDSQSEPADRRPADKATPAESVPAGDAARPAKTPDGGSPGPASNAAAVDERQATPPATAR